MSSCSARSACSCSGVTRSRVTITKSQSLCTSAALSANDPVRYAPTKFSPRIERTAATRSASTSSSSGKGVTALQIAECAHEVVRRRRREQQRVDAIEHAAVPAEQAPRVLHLHVALQHRLEEVAGDRDEDDRDAEDERLPDEQIVVAILVERDERDKDTNERADDQAFPRFPRRQGRRHPVPPDQPAA